MTIIQPNKNNNKTNFLISVLIMFSVVLVSYGILLYNQLVSLRHEITRQEKKFQQAETTNAELKNNFYNILDKNKLEPLIEQQSLILDKNPEYIKQQQVAKLQD